MMLNLFFIIVIATGYCTDSCGKLPTHPAYGIMANGERTHQGAIACPPQWAFGTKVYIPGEGWFVCEDRGSAITKNRIDRWFDTCEEAMEWGVKKKRVLVVGKLF